MSGPVEQTFINIHNGLKENNTSLILSNIESIQSEIQRLLLTQKELQAELDFIGRGVEELRSGIVKELHKVQNKEDINLNFTNLDLCLNLTAVQLLPYWFGNWRIHYNHHRIDNPEDIIFEERVKTK